MYFPSANEGEAAVYWHEEAITVVGVVWLSTY